MLKKITGNKAFYPILLIVIFSVISAFSLFMNGDDYLWYYSVDDPQLASWAKANGRLFSNQVTIWLTRSIPFRIVFVSVTITAFIILMGKIIGFEKAPKRLKYFLPLALIVIIPCRTYKETFLWISGFTNYIFSMVIILLYLFFVFKCIFEDYQPKKYSCLLFLVLGLIGGLCIEHVTIYSAVLALTAFFVVLKLKKKCLLHCLMYLSGSVAACVLMFGNNIYSDIYTDTDMVGDRLFKFVFSDVLHNAFSYVTIYYTKDYWIAPLLISLCFSVIYYKKNYSDKKPKYLKLTLSICWIYAGYSVFTSCFSNLRPINAAMKTVAVETSFSFIYVVSVVYLIYVLLEKKTMIRLCVYIVSSLLVTLPFIFISPVTPRCFMANYVFWVLFCGELVCFTIKFISSERSTAVIERAVGLVTLSLVFMISFVSLSNRYFDDLRYEYIKEQIDSGKRSINIMMLPYTEYTSDDLSYGLFGSTGHNGNNFYVRYRLMYHGLDYAEDNKYLEVETMTYDYYMEKES